MKKKKIGLRCVLLAVSVCAGLVSGCAMGNGNESVSNEDGTQQTPAVQKIGIVQYVEHESLDDIHRGIVDALAKEGFVDKQNISIDFQNGQGDQSNLKTISQKFVNDSNDLIIAIATPAAQSVAAETKTVPIIAASVTDMVSAALVESNEKPGGNVTGVSDMTPVAQQMDILMDIVPDAKKIGVAYCSNEVNSEVQVKLAQEYIAQRGLECVKASVVTTNDIAQVITSLSGKVDALYIPVDNTMASAMPTVRDACLKAKLPIVVGAAAMVKEGALASVAFDYYDAGVQSGYMAARILRGEKPADMPVEMVEQTKLYVNETFAKEMGITLPQVLRNEAAEVY